MRSVRNIAVRRVSNINSRFYLLRTKEILKMTAEIRKRTVDVIKGIAIIFVLITHFEWTAEQRQIVVFPFFINMAIPVFMIITGYVYSLSLQRLGIQHLEEAYRWRLIAKRLIRYTLPVIIVVIWELCSPAFHISGTCLDLMRWILSGTYGKGSYYYPVMVQVAFLFPIIYFILDIKKEIGLLICFFVNLLYELLAWAYTMNTDCFRFLAFRYVFVLAAGVYTFKQYKLCPFLSALMMAGGGAFIAAITYLGYETKILNASWATTNVISSLWIVPLTIWILREKKMRFLPLEIIGRASYHIFLVQMVYYRGYYTLLSDKVSTWQMHFLLGVLISLAIGIVFYYIEKPLQDQISRKLLK